MELRLKLRWRLSSLCGLALFLMGGSECAFGEDVSFNRDVRPILSDRCFACHGPDTHERKAKLRLDVATGEDGAYRTRKGSTAIKPGSLEDSELWYRITTTDEDDVMRYHTSLSSNDPGLIAVEPLRVRYAPSSPVATSRRSFAFRSCVSGP